MSFATRCKVMMLAVSLGVGGVASAQEVRGKLPEIGTDPFAAEQQEAERVPDPARGEQLFRECLKCHTVQPGEVKIGPSLAGIVGRRPGSLPAFGYSQDMIDFGTSGGIWDEVNLDQFLTRPRSMIAGTKMVFQGFRKPADREDLIAFLSTIRG